MTTTSAEELKRALQNKDVLAPKPFGAKPSFKGVKPPVCHDTSQKAFGLPQVSSNDILNHKLRSVSGNAAANEKPQQTDNANVPEFMRRKLKNPAERDAEKRDKAQKNISAALSKAATKPPPPLAMKPPPLTTKPKPPVVAKPISVTNGTSVNSNDSNSDHETDLPRRKGSVRDSLCFFEESVKRVNENVRPKPPVKPKSSSLPRNNVIQIKSEAPSNEEFPAPPSDMLDEGEELYDDVSLEQTHAKPMLPAANDNLFILPAIDVSYIAQKDDDIYDDVENHSTSFEQEKTLQTQLHPISSITNRSVQDGGSYGGVENHVESEQQNEIYDDVTEHQPQTPLGLPRNDANLIQDELYDDVREGIAEQSSEIYNDVMENQPSNIPERNMNSSSSENVDVNSQNDSTEVSSFPSPVKLPKTFDSVESSRLVPPFGLDRWLQELIETHKSQLKDFAKPHTVAPVVQRACKPPERIPTEDELQQDDIYEGIEPVIEEKENKINEKEKPKRGKSERDKKEKKKVNEKKEKKDEKKRREKEYKQFHLNPDVPLEFLGSMSCCIDYTPKKNDKLDLPYNVGEEISIVNAVKCPDGKMLAHHSTTGKIGYVWKKDFGMTELPAAEEMRPRTVSLIPTEDESTEQTNYEFISTAAPPVPATPRPSIRHDQEDELYDDVNDEGECIYEEL